MDSFQKQQFEEAGNYVTDTLLKQLTPFSDFHPVSGRPCEMALATFNHAPYRLYRYEDQLLLVPADLGSDYEGVISFRGTQDTFFYTILSKHQGTMDLTSYRFYTIPSVISPEVHFSKHVLRTSVEEDAYQKAFSLNSPEDYFFSEREYMRLFIQDPNLYQKVVDIRRTREGTGVLLRDLTGVKESQLTFPEEYEDVDDSHASLFEIADSYDIHNIK